MRIHTTQSKRQEGLVSIIVTMMLMVIITLIVLGFARASRREQRQALDRQLSTQAFYAAETGINDAMKVLTDNPTATKTGCGSSWVGLSAGYTVPSSDISTADGTSYTCLLVSSEQNNLEYDSVGYKAEVVPINTASDVRGVTITWEGTSGGVSGCNSGTIDQPVSSGWPNTCGPGLLRFDLVPLGNGSGLQRDGANGLVDKTMTAFLYPKNSGAAGTLDYAAATLSNKGKQVGVRCVSATNKCTFTITAIPANNTKLQLRIQSFYKESKVSVTAQDGSSATLPLLGGQIKIDSTGKAKDVLRRVQVRLPISESSSVIGDFAIQAADDLCKQFRVGTSYWDNNGETCNDP